MIFTTRALKINIKETSKPVEDFIAHKIDEIRCKDYKREVYFSRYIGIENEETAYINKLQALKMQVVNEGNNLYIDHLEFNMTPKESESYIKIYETWEKTKNAKVEEQFHVNFPVKMLNDSLELTQKLAFTEVMECFRKYTPHVNDSMLKNFGVKLLSWTAIYLPRIYPNAQARLPKVVYAGPIKRQEFLFLFFLSLMGCDILYINPEEDCKKMIPECDLFSFLYFAGKYQKINLTVVSQIPQAPLTRSVKKETSSVQDHQPTQGTNLGQKGSIHLSSPQKRTSAIRSSQPIRPSIMTSSQKGTSAQNSDLTRTPVKGHAERMHELSYEEIARLSTSIVMITVMDQSGEPYKSGSGVVIHEDGFILTNFHVVKGGRYFAIQFENDEQIYKTDRIIKYHPGYDLAIIKAEKSCKAIKVCRDSRLVRGQKVVAIGSPLGLFNSVSDGIISAFRQVGEKEMIQFTAAISNGSSGGALLNMYGQLVGIITAGIDEGQNINLAVNNQIISQFASNYLVDLL